MDQHTGPAIFFLKYHRLLKKIPAHKSRLSTLPCKGYFRYAVCCYGLPDVLLKNVIGHAEPAFRIQFSLTKVEAILAGQVTPGATGFGHEMESWEGASGHEENTSHLIGNKKGLIYAGRSVPHEPGIDFLFMINVAVSAYINNNTFDLSTRKKEGCSIIG